MYVLGLQKSQEKMGFIVFVCLHLVSLNQFCLKPTCAAATAARIFHPCLYWSGFIALTEPDWKEGICLCVNYMLLDICVQQIGHVDL